MNRKEGGGEKIRFRRMLTNAFLLGVMGLALLPPFVHYKTTGNIIIAAGGGKVDCSQMGEPSNTQGFPYDVIAVLGAGDIDSSNSFETRRLYGAAILWLTGNASKVALLEGEGVDVAESEKRLRGAVRHLSGYSREIPEDSIITKVSVNTAKTAQDMAEMVDIYNWKRVAVVTDNFHLSRSMILFCMNDIQASGYSVEEVVSRWAPIWTDYIQTPNSSPQMQTRRRKELMGLIDVMYTNGKGSILLKKIFSNLHGVSE